MKKPRLDPPHDVPNRSGLDGLLTWLREQGAEVDGLEFRDDGQSGSGVFATKRVSQGDLIASIPKKLVLTLAAARASPLGEALAAAGASDELLIWMYIAHGRTDASHPWHAYLASLPSVQPDPTAWPDEALAALRGTPLLHMVQEAKSMLAKELRRVLERLQPPSGEAVTWVAEMRNKLSFELLLWARGMHLSRCFPGSLGSGDGDVQVLPDVQCCIGWLKSNASPEVGCLLPLFDMLNHKTGQPIVWEASDGKVSFRAAKDLAQGDEVFNNYGVGRSNQELLFYYGFSELDLALSLDVVTGMVLACDFEEGSEIAAQLPEKHRRLLEAGVPCGLVGPSGSTLRLGPFELGQRTDTGSAPHTSNVLPGPLLFALAVAVASNAADEIPNDVAITALPADALALLHGTLVAALAEAHAAPDPPPEPAFRAASITAYREGRIRVLRSALEVTEDCLAAFASDDEGDCVADDSPPQAST